MFLQKYGALLVQFCHKVHQKCTKTTPKSEFWVHIWIGWEVAFVVLWEGNLKSELNDFHHLHHAMCLGWLLPLGEMENGNKQLLQGWLASSQKTAGKHLGEGQGIHDLSLRQLRSRCQGDSASSAALNLKFSRSRNTSLFRVKSFFMLAEATPATQIYWQNPSQPRLQNRSPMHSWPKEANKKKWVAVLDPKKRRTHDHDLLGKLAEINANFF